MASASVGTPAPPGLLVVDATDIIHAAPGENRNSVTILSAIVGPNQEQRQAPVWAGDSSSTSCTACSRPFSAAVRRHHCRYCGLLVCSPCLGELKVDRWLSDKKPHYIVSVPEHAPNDAAARLESKRVCTPCLQHVPAEVEARLAGGIIASGAQRIWVKFRLVDVREARFRRRSRLLPIGGGGGRRQTPVSSTPR
jgi:hypothetical protein